MGFNTFVYGKHSVRFEYLLHAISWNRFACDISSSLIRDTATTMKSLGFLDAGYSYINIDDCWLTTQRDSSGSLVVNATKFPGKSHLLRVWDRGLTSAEGMNNLTDFLHGLGFKAGIYVGAQPITTALLLTA